MIKKYLLFFICMFVLTIPTYSSLFDFPPRVDADSCQYLYLNETNFLSYVENKTLEDINAEIIEAFEQNDYNGYYQFRIYDYETGLDIDIIYTDKERIGNIFGTYFHQSPTRDSRIEIYIKEISIYYEGTIYDNLDDIKRSSYNTLKHEIIHYLDIEEKVFGDDENIKNIFNITGDRESISFETKQYYENVITPKAYEGDILLPFVLQDSLNFTGVFQRYDSDDHFDEIIARVSAVCLYYGTWNESTFNYAFRPSFCENFQQLGAVSNEEFNEVSKDIFSGFYLQEYPQENDLRDKTTGICKADETTKSIFTLLGYFITNLTIFWTENLVLLIIAFAFSVFIGTILSIIYKFIAKNFFPK